MATSGFQSLGVDPYVLKRKIINPIIEKVLDITIGKYKNIQHDYSRVPVFLEFCKEELNKVFFDFFDEAVDEGLRRAREDSQLDHSGRRISSLASSDKFMSRKQVHDGGGLSRGHSVISLDGLGAESAFLPNAPLGLSMQSNVSLIPDTQEHSNSLIGKLREQLSSSKTNENYLRSVASDVINQFEVKDSTIVALKGVLQRREVMMNEQRQAYISELLHVRELLRQFKESGTCEIADATLYTWGKNGSSKQEGEVLSSSVNKRKVSTSLEQRKQSLKKHQAHELMNTLTSMRTTNQLNDTSVELKRINNILKEDKVCSEKNGKELVQSSEKTYPVTQSDLEGISEHSSLDLFSDSVKLSDSNVTDSSKETVNNHDNSDLQTSLSAEKNTVSALFGVVGDCLQKRGKRVTKVHPLGNLELSKVPHQNEIDVLQQQDVGFAAQGGIEAASTPLIMSDGHLEPQSNMTNSIPSLMKVQPSMDEFQPVVQENEKQESKDSTLAASFPITSVSRIKKGASNNKRTVEPSKQDTQFSQLKLKNKSLIQQSATWKECYELKSNENPIEHVRFMDAFLYRLSNVVEEALEKGSKCRAIKWRILQKGLQYQRVLKKYEAEIMKVEYCSGYDDSSLRLKGEHEKLNLFFNQKIKALHNSYKNMEKKSNECWVDVLIHASRIASFGKLLGNSKKVKDVPGYVSGTNVSTQNHDGLRLKTMNEAEQQIREKYNITGVVQEWNATIGATSGFISPRHSFMKGCIENMKPHLFFCASSVDCFEDKRFRNGSRQLSQPDLTGLSSKSEMVSNMDRNIDNVSLTYEKETCGKVSALDTPVLEAIESASIPSVSLKEHYSTESKVLTSACLRKGPSHNMLGCYYHSAFSRKDNLESNDYHSIKYKLDVSSAIEETHTNQNLVVKEDAVYIGQGDPIESDIERKQTKITSGNSSTGTLVTGNKDGNKCEAETACKMDLHTTTIDNHCGTSHSGVHFPCRMERLSSRPSTTRPIPLNWRNNIESKNSSHFNVTSSVTVNSARQAFFGEQGAHCMTSNTPDPRNSRISFGHKADNNKFKQSSVTYSPSLPTSGRGLDLRRFRTLNPTQKRHELLQLMKMDQAQSIIDRKVAINYVYEQRNKAYHNNTITSVDEIDAGVYRTKLYGRGEHQII